MCKDVSCSSLRRQYLGVYGVVMLADWLQGTNMFTLYDGYGFNVATLFLTGFMSSALCSVFVGRMVDHSGRRFSCLLYCVLEIVIQVIEHIQDFRILLLGRIIGGISTSILFSAFESWVVSEHHKRKLPEECLAHTFAYSSTLNGLMAVIAGPLARVSFLYAGGDIGPFRLALGLTIVAFILVAGSWDENFGDKASETKESGDKIVKSSSGTLHAFKLIYAMPAVATIGLVQVLFEGAMFTFVFSWVPCLSNLYGDGRAPIELLFSVLMLSLSAGGLVVERLTSDHIDPRNMGIGVLGIGIVAMLCAMVFCETNFWIALAAFCVFEACVGAFQPWAATTRSLHVPDGVMATVMNVFRVPLNLLVMAGVKLADTASLPVVFGFCTGLQAVALILVYFRMPRRELVVEHAKKQK